MKWEERHFILEFFDIDGVYHRRSFRASSEGVIAVRELAAEVSRAYAQASGNQPPGDDFRISIVPEQELTAGELIAQLREDLVLLQKEIA